MERFNETYRVVQPMKYATAKKSEVLAAALASDNYCIQLKRDGSSYVLAKDLDGSVHLYGDKISRKNGLVIDKIDNVPHIKEWAEKVFPCGSQVIIEICYGESSKDTNRIMLALPPKAWATQQTTQVAEAYVFDILFWAGNAMHTKDFGERWDNIVKIFEVLAEVPEFVTLAETHYVDKSEVIAEWLSKGYEGGVLKMLESTSKTSAKHHIREIGATAARPMNTCFKIKQVDTVDVVIMDVLMPTSTYTGKDPDTHKYRDADGNPINRLYALGYANSFAIGAYNEDGWLVQIGTVASGLDDAMREAAAKNPDDFIDLVIEVDCMSKDCKEKTLRHPRMMASRPEKNHLDCTLSHIFG